MLQRVTPDQVFALPAHAKRVLQALWRPSVGDLFAYGYEDDVEAGIRVAVIRAAVGRAHDHTDVRTANCPAPGRGVPGFWVDPLPDSPAYAVETGHALPLFTVGQVIEALDTFAVERQDIMRAFGDIDPMYILWLDLVRELERSDLS